MVSLAFLHAGLISACNECVICREKKLRQAEVVMNHYNNALLNLEPKPC